MANRVPAEQLVPEQAQAVIDGLTDDVEWVINEKGVRTEQFRTDDGPYAQCVEATIDGVKVRVTVVPVA